MNLVGSGNFKYPPLVSVATEIRFKTLLSVVQKASEFQDAVINDFPNYREENIVDILLTQTGELTKDSTSKIMIYTSEDSLTTLKISSNNFVLIEQDVKKHSFKRFNEKLNKYFIAFSKLYKLTNYIWCGLRYVNNIQIRREQDNRFNFNKHIKNEFVSKYNQQELISATYQTILNKNNKKLTIRAGVLPKEKTHGKDSWTYILDLDCNSSLGGNIEDIKHFLKDAHDNIIKPEFMNYLTDEYIMYMDTGRWR